MARILVIEDEAPLREEILEWLGFEGYEALGTGNGQEGIALARQWLPDLILTDLRMPEVDGYRVLLELRAIPATAMIPIIIISALAERQDMRRGLELGAEDYITKPFSRDELFRAIQTQLEKQRLLQQQREQALDQLRRTVIYSLPYELLAPLNSILGFGELLLKYQNSLNGDDIVGIASQIVENGKCLHHLIENYLIYAQLEIMSANPSYLAALSQARINDVAKAVSDIVHSLAVKYGRKEDLVLNLTAAPAAISEKDLQKVVYELVDNAFKFSQPRTPVCVTQQAEQGYLILCVADQGPGMTAEQIQKIGAYMQFEHKLNGLQGLGFGLIIAKRLAQLYGGKLEIDSVPGQGTRACVHLPAGSVHPDADD